MPTLVDSYSESNVDSAMTLYAALDLKAAQSFTAAGDILESCKFYLKLTGAPTGTVSAALFSHDGGTFGSGGKPTGTALATSITSIDVSTLTTSYALSTFYFNSPNQFKMVSGTNYFIALVFTSTSSDASNFVNVGRDNSSPTHAGNAARFGTIWNSSTSDLCFYVYSTTLHVEVPSHF